MRLILEIVCALVTVAGLYLYLETGQPDMSNWILLTETISAKAEPSRTREFAAKRPLRYHIFLEYNAKSTSDFRRLECFTGVTLGRPCDAALEGIDVDWMVLRNGREFASGTAKDNQGGFSSGQTIYREIGSFEAQVGDGYSVELMPHRPLGKETLYVKVQTYPKEWQDELSSAATRHWLAIGLGSIGATLLYVSLMWRWLSRVYRRRDPPL